MPVTASQRLIELVNAYSARVRPAILAQQHEDSISSALGIWLLLAAAVPAAQGAARAELEEALGCEATVAQDLLKDFLRQQPQAIEAGLALWTAANVRTDALRTWEENLPRSVERGSIPSQAVADAWAQKMSKGLLQSFPLRLSDHEILPDSSELTTAIILSSIVATDVKWLRKFQIVDSSELEVSPIPYQQADNAGQTPIKSPWRGRVNQILRAPEEWGHQSGLYQTASAGLVAAHVASAAENLKVLTVIAEPEVDRERALAAAHEVAAADRGDDTKAQRVNLFDLPLGLGHAWELTERRVESTKHANLEKYRLFIPAWRLDGQPVDLFDRAFGATAALDALLALLPPPDDTHRYEDLQVMQKALAQYTYQGFKAVAYTGFAGSMRIMAAFPETYRVRERTAVIRFGRPFAALALAATTGNEQEPFSGLPVFEAWIAAPDEAKED
jgi:hypothetical protein